MLFQLFQITEKVYAINLEDFVTHVLTPDEYNTNSISLRNLDAYILIIRK